MIDEVFEGERIPEVEEVEIDQNLSFKKRVDLLAYRLFGRLFEGRRDAYAGLRKKMNQARMEVGTTCTSPAYSCTR
ncbi:MAG: hypothetical protein SV377_07230 [Halobacteria archaeon]|nr:hypothetical protein [Halobacteria archaeon]